MCSVHACTPCYCSVIIGAQSYQCIKAQHYQCTKAQHYSALRHSVSAQRHWPLHRKQTLIQPLHHKAGGWERGVIVTLHKHNRLQICFTLKLVYSKPVWYSVVSVTNDTELFQCTITWCWIVSVYKHFSWMLKCVLSLLRKFSIFWYQVILGALCASAVSACSYARLDASCLWQVIATQRIKGMLCIFEGKKARVHLHLTWKIKSCKSMIVFKLYLFIHCSTWHICCDPLNTVFNGFQYDIFVS